MASTPVGLVVLVALSVVTSVSGLPNGAPTSACSSMVPGHTNISPQTSAAPFTITVSSLYYSSPGDTITVTITATGAALVGFLLQARLADPNLDTSTPQGTFTAVANSKIITCSAVGDTLTHTDAFSNSFTTLSVVWTAPATIAGHIQFKATLAQTKALYWLDVMSPLVNDSASGAIVTTPSTSLVTSSTTSTTEPPTLQLDDDMDNSEIDVSGCGSTKGCIRTPSGCATADCDSIITWAQDTDTAYINFEMARKSTGGAWIGLGLSSDKSMGGDSVIECKRATDGTQTVSQSLNIARSNTAIANPKYEGLDNVKVGYINGQQVCRFRRKKVVTGRTSEIFDLNTQYYVIIAQGNTFLSGSTIGIMKHSSTPLVSDTPMDFTKNIDSSVAASIPVNVKAHGCLMIVAWIMLSAFGVTMARHFKKQWPGSKICGKDSWYPLHAGAMVSTVLFTIIAFIIIFVHVKGYSNITATPAILQAHPVLGIIVTLLALFNPIMAVFRPAPDSANRYIFNWAHWGVGTSARVLAVITVFLGVSLPTVKDIGQAGNLVYIMIGYVCFYALVEIILEVHRCMTKPGRSASSMELKSPGEMGSGAASSESNSGQLFRNVMLGILLAGLLSFGLACVIIIAIS